MLAFTLLRNSPIAASLGNDLSVELFQMLYDRYWHQGSKEEVLRDVVALVKSPQDEDQSLPLVSPKKRKFKSELTTPTGVPGAGAAQAAAADAVAGPSSGSAAPVSARVTRSSARVSTRASKQHKAA